MSTYDLTGTVYKILPEVFAEVFGHWKLRDVQMELGVFDDGADEDDLRGRLVARRTHKIAAAIVSELSRIEVELAAPQAPRTGRRGERAA